MIEPRNLVLVYNDPNAVYGLLAQGYKLLLCTEDSLPQEFLVHPNTLKLSILLPPYEAVSLESDQRFDEAIQMYWMYIMSDPTAMTMVDIIYVSALLGNPMALYLGTEVNDLKLIQSLPQFFANQGLNFNVYAGYGSIETNIAPIVISRLYLGGEILPMQALAYYPKGLNFTPDILQKLIVDLRPPVDINDYEAANAYFKSMVSAIDGNTVNKYGQKLYSPIVGGSA